MFDSTPSILYIIINRILQVFSFRFFYNDYSHTGVLLVQFVTSCNHSDNILLQSQSQQKFGGMAGHSMALGGEALQATSCRPDNQIGTDQSVTAGERGLTEQHTQGGASRRVQPIVSPQRTSECGGRLGTTR